MENNLIKKDKLIVFKLNNVEDAKFIGKVLEDGENPKIMLARVGQFSNIDFNTECKLCEEDTILVQRNTLEHYSHMIKGAQLVGLSVVTGLHLPWFESGDVPLEDHDKLYFVTKKTHLRIRERY